VQTPFRCGGHTAFDGVLSQQVSDLLITPATLVGTAVILPAGTPLAPFVVQTRITPPSGGMAAANFSNQLPSGYTFALCNHSTS
jgi:hypothetical protein